MIIDTEKLKNIIKAHWTEKVKSRSDFPAYANGAMRLVTDALLNIENTEHYAEQYQGSELKDLAQIVGNSFNSDTMKFEEISTRILKVIDACTKSEDKLIAIRSIVNQMMKGK